MPVFAPSWNLDVAGARRLEEAIKSLEGAVVIDLSGVAFVASSGLRVLLKQAQRLKFEGGELRVCGADKTVTEVFKMSGFDKIIAIDDECGAGSA
jgi:anti-sigma B factor antagonist